MTSHLNLDGELEKNECLCPEMSPSEGLSVRWREKCPVKSVLLNTVSCDLGVWMKRVVKSQIIVNSVS